MVAAERSEAGSCDVDHRRAVRPVTRLCPSPACWKLSHRAGLVLPTVNDAVLSIEEGWKRGSQATSSVTLQKCTPVSKLRSATVRRLSDTRNRPAVADGEPRPGAHSPGRPGRCPHKGKPGRWRPAAIGIDGLPERSRRLRVQAQSGVLLSAGGESATSMPVCSARQLEDITQRTGSWPLNGEQSAANALSSLRWRLPLAASGSQAVAQINDDARANREEHGSIPARDLRHRVFLQTAGARNRTGTARCYKQEGPRRVRTPRRMPAGCS